VWRRPQQVGEVGARFADVALDVLKIGGNGDQADVACALSAGPVEQAFIGEGVECGLGLLIGVFTAGGEHTEVIAVLPEDEARQRDEVYDSQ